MGNTMMCSAAGLFSTLGGTIVGVHMGHHGAMKRILNNDAGRLDRLERAHRAAMVDFFRKEIARFKEEEEHKGEGGRDENDNNNNNNNNNNNSDGEGHRYTSPSSSYSPSSPQNPGTGVVAIPRPWVGMAVREEEFKRIENMALQLICLYRE
jgi:hypothetical protein